MTPTSTFFKVMLSRMIVVLDVVVVLGTKGEDPVVARKMGVSTMRASRMSSDPTLYITEI